MHYSKLSSNLIWALLLAGVCTLPAAAANGKQTVFSCLESGKKSFAAKNYRQAQDTFTRCLKMDPDNVEALLSLAGVLLTQNDLNGADKQFKAALSNMTRTSPYWSYTYSMLGDIALKRQQNDTALKMYSKSLEYNAANVNSLVGKGVIVEYQGDKQGAAEYYRAALAVEPLNLIARKRLISLEPDYLTDAEMLTALKQRYAVDPNAKELTEEDRALFTKIHRAEQRGGLDYLKNKYPRLPKEYAVTINKDTDFAREMLTLDGYNALEKSIGQDALAVFQKAGVPTNQVFDLRDRQGQKIFTQQSTLTESGFAVYTQALKGRKAFLLPNEDVPPTQEFLTQVAARVKQLQDAGYVEITRSELKMIENQTKCSENTLVTKLGVYILKVTKNERRYFVLARQTADPKMGVPYYYLMASRAKRNPKLKVPSNSLVESYAFYGYTVCLDDGDLLE